MLAWILVGFGGATLAAAVTTGLQIEPGPIVVPLAAVLVLAGVFVLRPVAGVATFLLFVLMAATLEHWMRADLRFFDELAVATMVALSGLMNWSRIVVMRPGWKEAALGLAVGAAITSSIVAAVPPETWLPALVLLVKGVAFFYAVSWLRLHLAEVERAGAALLLTASLILVLAFLEIINPGRFQEALGLPISEATRGDVTVVKSLFLHPAIFGWFTAFVSLFLYARFIVLREWWTLPSALLLNVGTVLSGRRRPVIGVLAALGVGMLWFWRQRRPLREMVRTIAPLAAAIVVVALLTAPLLSDFYAATLDEYLGRGDLGSILSSDPDVTVIAGSHPRMALYVGSLAVARDHFPFGAGLGRYGSYMSEAHYSPLYGRYGLDAVYGLGPDYPVAISDTFWPMILGEAGPLGLVGFAGFLGILLVKLWRVASDSASPRLRAFALGGLFVFVEGVVGSLTAATYVAPPIAYYLFASAAVALAAARTDREGVSVQRR